ncbi:MAG: hypothetical protein ABIT36_02010 [Steroidobacteraceae bacterium]
MKIDINRRVLLQSAAGMAFASTQIARAAAPEEPAVAPWGDPATLVSAVGAGTLSVINLAQSLEAYHRGFGYVTHWQGKIPKETATLWGVPAMAGRGAAVVGPPGFNRGMIRMVELGKDFQETSLQSTLGWMALEIHIKSPDDIVKQLQGLPFVHTGGPGLANAPDGQPLYRAAQFKGPSGEPLYMTQHMQLDKLISAGVNNVGPLFIVTLNTTPYEPTRDFYQRTLGMTMRMEIKGRGGSRMSAVRATEYCAIQIDELAANTPRRPAAPGCFAAGVNVCTLTTRNINRVKSALTEAKQPFTEVASNLCPPFQGARGIYLTGRGGERVEIMQVAGAM